MEGVSTIKMGKKYNKYDLSGEFGIGYTSKGEEFYFDLEDYDKIKDYCWSISSIGYVVSREYITGKKICMHKILVDYKIVDHKNRIRHDNRKDNLRNVTLLENSRNRGLQSNNTHSVTGVYYRKERNSWYAQITIDGKTKTLIYTHDKNEAIRARLQAEADYFGDFAPQKHLFDEYEIKYKGVNVYGMDINECTRKI